MTAQSISKYNSLNGEVSKESLIELAKLADKEGQHHIALKIRSILDDSEKYYIESVRPEMERENLEEINISDVQQSLTHVHDKELNYGTENLQK